MSYNEDEEDIRRIYLVSSALSPDEYRTYPKWFAELVPAGPFTLTLNDMIVFADRFGIPEQDKWKIFDIFESPLNIFEKGEFYAFVRLIGHVLDGKVPSRELVFQQAPVPKFIDTALKHQPGHKTHFSQLPLNNAQLPSSSSVSILEASGLRDGISAESSGSESSHLATSPGFGISLPNPFRKQHNQENQPSTNRTFLGRPRSSVELKPQGPPKPLESAMKKTVSPSPDVISVDAFTRMLLTGDHTSNPQHSPVLHVPEPKRTVKFAMDELDIALPTVESSSEDKAGIILREEPVTFQDTEHFVDSVNNNLAMQSAVTLESTHQVASLPSEIIGAGNALPVVPAEQPIRRSLDGDRRRPAPPPPRHRKPAHSSQPPTSGIKVPVTAETAPVIVTPSIPLSSSPKLGSSVDTIVSFNIISLESSPRFSSSPIQHEVSYATAPIVSFDQISSNSAQQKHVPRNPPPPPPPVRKKATTGGASVVRVPSTHRHDAAPPPPPPMTHTQSLPWNINKLEVTTMDESLVPDLLADLTALQKEVDAFRVQDD
ncbi:hypothetical protein V1514DRAFT_328141 [Lipomyces japonicus]|uniref:uncharacterized protein n=1 Tax=Lipomyces japonicus TaxID=56871 RepID=UPI0034CFD281